MTQDLHNRLTALKNYATRYEIALQSPDGRRFLLYYGRKSTSSILTALTRQHDTQEPLIAICGQFARSDSFRTTARGSIAVAISDNGWTILPTGRTQRDAYCNGELPRARAAAQQPA